MSEAETMIAPTWRARLADPKPAFCTGCLRGADAQTVFVEFASISSGRGQLREFGSMAVVADLDRFALCQSCVGEMAECIAFRPHLHAAQRDQLQKLVDERNQLRRENAMLRSLVAEGLTANAEPEEKMTSGARGK